MGRLKVLVVNDDGIHSRGLADLVRALSEKADVYVSAPETQMSGASQSITLTDTIHVYAAEIPFAQGALVVTGTPADCTKAGIQFFGEQGISFDVIYSGINLGSNLGVDTLYSGTVGAAMEGSISGVRSVAVSVDSLAAEDFTIAAEVAVDIMEYVLEKTTPDTILNINVPYLSREEIKGVRATRLGGRYYTDRFVVQENGAYKLDGIPEPDMDHSLSLDMAATGAGYITITPINYDYTQEEMLESVASCGLKLRTSDS